MNKNSLVLNKEYFLNLFEEEFQQLILSGHDDERIPFLFKNQNILAELFFKWFDIQNNPKKDLLYSIAYSFGHSSGLNEIYNYMSELICLIK